MIQEETPDGMGPQPSCVGVLLKRTSFGELIDRYVSLAWPQEEIFIATTDDEPFVERPWNVDHPKPTLSVELRARRFVRTPRRQLGRVTAEWWFENVSKVDGPRNLRQTDMTASVYLVYYIEEPL